MKPVKIYVSGMSATKQLRNYKFDYPNEISQQKAPDTIKSRDISKRVTRNI